jgi:DNA polymerase sigma
VIKFTDSETGICFDICFNMENGIQNSTTICHLIEVYKEVCIHFCVSLIFVRSWINLVFDQARPLFLLVKYLLFTTHLNEVYTGGIGSYSLILMIVSFLQQKSDKDRCNSTMSDLLVDFFCYYGTEFNYYSTTICVTRDGVCLDKVKKGWFNDKNPHLLSIEDPNDESNVCLFSYNLNIIDKLTNAI